MSGEHQEIPELIEAAKGAGEEAARAAARLAEIGMPAFGAVVDAARQPSGPSEALSGALLRMRGPEVTAALTGLLAESDAFLPSIAAEALGRAGDARAVRPLLDLYGNEMKSESARGAAARALGELGDGGVVPELLKTAREVAGSERREERVGLVCAAAAGLARLGNQELAEAVARLALSQDRVVADEAAFALKHVVGRGLFPALRKARRSRMTEARQESLRAIYYLGIPESIEELISYAEGGDDSAPDLVYEAVLYLHDLTGQDFKWNIDPKELRRWWKQNRAQYEPGVSYRLGRPSDLNGLAELLAATEAARLGERFDELRLITGEDFGLDPFRPAEAQPEVAERAQKWLRENADRYERGAAYRYGHRQSLEHVLKPPARPRKASKKASKKQAKKGDPDSRSES